MDVKTDWNILLIGGCSGTGKSTLASTIANHYQAELGRVDDYRMVLQSATKPECYPELHFFISSPGVPKKGVWGNSPEVLCDALIKVGEFVSSNLEVVIDHHIHTGNRIVLEGDGIIPEMVYRAKKKYNDSLCSVFLYEPNKGFFFEKNVPAEKSNNKILGEVETIRTMHWLYGQWLMEEARKLNLSLVQSRPWETLCNRVLSTIN